MTFKTLLSGLILVLGLSAAQTLTVLTHDSFNISQAVIDAFTAETGIGLEFIAAGDANEVVSRAILTRDNPLGDLLYGVDNSSLSRAVAAGIFEPYESPNLTLVNPRYQFDPEHFVTPINVGYVNFNIDLAYFETTGLALPSDISELTEPEYARRTVVQNPATSSPGLAFMLTTIARFGEGMHGDWLDYWAALRDNGVQVTDGWSNAYYTAFSLYGGDRPIVLSYASSPTAEVIFAEEPLEEAPTVNLFCESCVFEQIEAIGILRGSSNIEAAQQFIDFMLTETFQQDIAPNMFVYPVVDGTSLPPEFNQFGQIPTTAESVQLDSATIETNLTRWLNQWTQVVEQNRAPEAVR